MDYHGYSAAAYGLSPANVVPGAAGASTPATTGGSPGDHGLLPWHPDSPTFWLALVAGATLLGWVGAEFGARVGPAKGDVKVGKV